MKLIAAKAGLSGAAVSLALRDHPSIPPTTRARVKRLAERLGYRSFDIDPQRRRNKTLDRRNLGAGIGLTQCRERSHTQFGRRDRRIDEP